MTLSLETRLESDTLVAIVHGRFSLQDAQRIFLEAFRAALRQKATKVLFDGQTLTGDLPTLERFHLAKFTAEAVLDLQAQGAPTGMKFACVLREPLLDPERFGETVAVNRGMLVKGFDNLEEARAWLDREPEDAANVNGNGVSESRHSA